ncbi:MAG: Hpt domain-containing protein, partial [Gammaproteobacteria bacterium]|nr:Hpt domain-containing protein [Gammaproteobacteria bacterium]
MQNSEQFDVSTLAWVKDEIDDTLNQARIALESFVDDEDDASYLRQFIDLLHQVQGTLNIVELTGAAQFAGEVESLAAKVGDGEIDDHQQAFDLMMRSILLLPDYLESLLGGKQDDSTPLIPLLNGIRELKGETKLNPFQYFIPDLKILPPDDFGSKNPDAPIKSVAQKIHHHFQSALLNVLREKDLNNSFNKLAVVLDKFSQYVVNDYVRQWMWVSIAFVDAFKSGQLQLAREHKSVLGKIEQAIKIIGQSGEKGISKGPLLKLTKAILWHISNIEGAPADSRVGQLQLAFKIGSASVSEGSGVTLTSDLKQAVSNDILTELTGVKDTFDLFV